MTYRQKLEEAIQAARSCLCVGLDPNLQRIPEAIKKEHPEPEQQVLHFLKAVIDVTAPHCAAYKPNLGFFEALGAPGLQVFQEVLNIIPDNKIIIADAKRGDISSTAEHYAQAYFEQFDVDAITINPLMGFETLDPFMHYPRKGVYVLTLTSNPGAGDLLSRPFGNFSSMAEYIADRLATKYDKHATHIGMVLGATRPKMIIGSLARHPHGALLIPGIGTQGGSVDALSAALEGHSGLPLVNSSRSILYAGQHADNWQQAVAEQASKFQTALEPIVKPYV